MNKISNIIFILAFAVSTMTGCYTVKAQTETVLEHRITYDAKGTRSESRHGYLYVDGNAVPDVFQLVYDGQKYYSFRTRSNMWGDDGYHVAYRDLEIPRSDKSVTAQEFDRGWYLGKKKKSGTPKHWIYVEWNQESAFTAPSALTSMAEDLNLRPINRVARLKLELPVRRNPK